MRHRRNLPQVVQDALDKKEASVEARLDAIGEVLTSKRTEAVSARKASGIEDVWTKAEEAYNGIDDENRSEFSAAKWMKPMTMNAGIRTAARNSDARSTVFIPLTSRYVDAGSAKLGEILIPIDDKSFSFDCSPLPDMIKGKEDTTPVAFADGTPMMRDAKPEEAPPPQPGQPPQPAPDVQLTIKDFAEEQIGIAKKAAKKAETRIYDWMVESQYQSEMRKVIFDGARIGVGVMKAPFPEKRKTQAVSKTPDGVTMQIVEKIVPAARSISAWDCFPDPSCGEKFSNGEFFFERDYLSAKQIKSFKGQKGYISSRIDKVIEEGPGKCNLNQDRGQSIKSDHRFECWYFYGTLSREDMDALVSSGGIDSDAFLGDSKDDVFAIVTMINDTPIRATVNPLDSGTIPYNSFSWRRRPGHWAGVGIGEQIITPQRIINSASRALFNNAGKSAGAQIVMDRGSITPADGQWTVTPDKLWFMNADATINDVRAAFTTFSFPNMGQPLMGIIEYALRLAEESTSIPMITQGMTAPTTPETFGAAQLQNSNANQLLRAIGYSVDDDLTEPVVRAYYEWLLLDPEVPDDEKGDWSINAHGSAGLVERAIQDQTISQIGPMTVNPAFGVDPKKWFSQMMKSKRLDPRDFQYSEEELAKMQQQQPTPAPAVQAAQIRAQSAEKIAASRSQEAVQISQQDIDRDTEFVQSQERRDAAVLQGKMRELDMKLQLAQLEYASKHQISLEELKTRLAETSMKLSTQKDLTLAGLRVDVHKHGAPQVATPLVEPAGRAPDGQAYAL